MKMPKITKEKAREQMLDLLILLVASAIGAYSTVSIMIPYGLTSGGLTGIVRIIQSQIDFSFSLMFYGGAGIILILVAIFLGFREVRKILLLTIMFPAALMLFEYLQLPFLPVHDMFSCRYLLRRIQWHLYRYDLLERVFLCRHRCLIKDPTKKLFPHISQSKILMGIDAVIIIASAFFFGINIALYALVTQVILSKTIDFVLYGFESKIVQMEIITQKADILVDFIMNDIGRGVSIHKVEGGYTRQTRDQLRLLCSPRESISVKRGIAKLDPDAFVTLMQVDSVWGFGKGFGDIKKD
jgi:uncharacterized membrane-anchored protein YitT (DUF2179 family)